MVDKYIKEILFEQSKVYIPNLGLIYKDSINQNTYDSNTINQPVYSLEIDQEYRNEEDTWLVYAVARGQHVTLEEAELLIKERVDEIKLFLEEENKIDLEDIGTIINDAGKLKFNNTVLENVVAESDDNFGIPSSIIVQEEERDQTPLSEPVYQSSFSNTSQTPEQENIEGNMQEDNSLENYSQFYEEDQEARQSRYLKIGAIFIGLILALGLVYYLLTRSDSNTEDTVASIEQNTLPSENSSDSSSLDQTTYVDGQGSEAGSTTTNIPLSVKEPGKRYYIIAGAFTINENAQKLKRRLSTKGIKATILEPNHSSPLYRVSLADFEEFNDALAKINVLKKSHGNSIWILKY